MLNKQKARIDIQEAVRESLNACATPGCGRDAAESRRVCHGCADVDIGWLQIQERELRDAGLKGDALREEMLDLFLQASEHANKRFDRDEEPCAYPSDQHGEHDHEACADAVHEFVSAWANDVVNETESLSRSGWKLSLGGLLKRFVPNSARKNLTVRDLLVLEMKNGRVYGCGVGFVVYGNDCLGRSNRGSFGTARKAVEFLLSIKKEEYSRLDFHVTQAGYSVENSATRIASWSKPKP